MFQRISQNRGKLSLILFFVSLFHSGPPETGPRTFPLLNRYIPDCALHVGYILIQDISRLTLFTQATTVQNLLVPARSSRVYKQDKAHSMHELLPQRTRHQNDLLPLKMLSPSTISSLSRRVTESSRSRRSQLRSCSSTSP